MHLQKKFSFEVFNNRYSVFIKVGNFYFVLEIKMFLQFLFKRLWYFAKEKKHYPVVHEQNIVLFIIALQRDRKVLIVCLSPLRSLLKIINENIFHDHLLLLYINLINGHQRKWERIITIQASNNRKKVSKSQH